MNELLLPGVPVSVQAQRPELTRSGCRCPSLDTRKTSRRNGLLMRLEHPIHCLDLDRDVSGRQRRQADPGAAFYAHARGSSELKAWLSKNTLVFTILPIFREGEE